MNTLKLPNNQAPIKIFYSYSHEDENYRIKLEKHLALLRRNRFISEWHDRKIIAGSEWKQEIDTNLESSDIIILLVSKNFISSDYCYNIELKRALERHNSKAAIVLPIILSDCDWQEATFGKLQALPKDGKPVSSWDPQDKGWLNIVQGIKNRIKSIKNGSFSLVNGTLIPINSTPEVIDLGILFKNLLQDIYAKTCDKYIPNCSAEHKSQSIQDINSRYSEFDYATFLLEYFRENSVIMYCEEAIKDLAESYPNHKTIILDSISDFIQKLFLTYLRHPEYAPLDEYFRSAEYGQNVLSSFKLKYRESLKAEFSTKRLLQEESLCLNDIYIKPSFVLDDRCLDSEDFDQTKMDIHSFLYSVFRNADNCTTQFGLKHNILLNRCIVFGYPGQGKTSLCKCIAYEMLSLPGFPFLNVFLLPLRNIQSQMLEEIRINPLKCIGSIIQKQVFNDRNIELEQILNKSLIILDGLDELDINDFLLTGKYKQFLDSLLAIKMNCTIVVTSRYVDIEWDNLQSNQLPLIFRLKEFDGSQQKKWIENYKKFNPDISLTEQVVDLLNLRESDVKELEELSHRLEYLKKDKERIEQSISELNADLKENISTFRKQLEIESSLSDKLRKEELVLNDLQFLEPNHAFLTKLKHNYAGANIQLIFDDITNKRKLFNAQKMENSKCLNSINDKVEDFTNKLLAQTADKELSIRLETTNNEIGKLHIQSQDISRRLDVDKSLLIAIKPIKDLLSQPLLLYLITKLKVPLIDNSQNVLTKVHIYSTLVTNFVDSLFGELVNRASYDSHRVGQLSNTTKDGFMHFIEDLSFALFESGKEIITFADAKSLVVDFMERIKMFNNENPNSLKGILPTFYFKKIDSEDGAIEFAHKSFREYMTARKLWSRISSLALESIGDTRNELCRILSIRMLTSDILEFLAGIVKSGNMETVEKSYAFLKDYFISNILNDAYLNSSRIAEMCNQFYNAFSLIRIINSAEDLLYEDTKVVLFSKFLKILLISNPNIELDLSSQSIDRDAISISPYPCKIRFKEKIDSIPYEKTMQYYDFYK